MDLVRSDLHVVHTGCCQTLCLQKSQWLIQINGKSNVWKCELTDTIHYTKHINNWVKTNAFSSQGVI